MTLPDPREQKGDFIGDDLSEVHTCHAECPCRESGPDPVAVPEKVEAVARAIGEADCLTLYRRELSEGRFQVLATELARAALSVMGSGKVEVEAGDLESLLDTYDRPGNEVTARLRAVLEQEGGGE